MNEECSKTASSDADNTINIGDETKKTLNRDCFCSPSKATSNGRGESSCFDYHAKLIMKNENLVSIHTARDTNTICNCHIFAAYKQESYP